MFIFAEDPLGLDSSSGKVVDFCNRMKVRFPVAKYNFYKLFFKKIKSSLFKITNLKN
jgi:hypothetical protein